MPNGIIADPDALEEEFIPQDIPCREAQKKELEYCLSPVERGRRPLDCLCHGRPGTGKTAEVCSGTSQRSHECIRGFCVNCWENKTLNTILDRLIAQAGVMVAAKDYSAKISRLEQKVRGRACVIALDEIDRLDREDLNDAVYMLKNLGKVGVVCVSNTRKYVLNLDQRTASRMRFKSIKFPRYSDEELLMILNHRIVDCRALFPKTYSKPVL